MRHAVAKSLSALTVTAALAGCAFDPSALTPPGAGVDGPTYRLHIEFADALNLPARAQVVANGVQVGDLRAVTVVDPTPSSAGYVIADVEISRAVRLPVDTRAQLRQNTLLGDVFIALSAPTGQAVSLPDNGTIPLARSEPALQVEDALAGLATFVQGGAVHQFQDIVNRMNTVLPAEPADSARIAEVLGRDLTDVAAHLDGVGALLDGVHANTQVLVDNRRALSELLSETGATHVTEAVRSIILVLGAFGALGTVAHSLEWLGPTVVAGDAAAKALLPMLFTDRPLDPNAPSNLNTLVSLIRDRLLPFLERGAKVDVVPVLGATGDRAEQTARIVDTLRMIGLLR